MKKINDCRECEGMGEITNGKVCPLCKGEKESPTVGKPLLRIIGTDGNAFALLARAQSVAKKAGMPTDQISMIIDEAMCGDYDHLLQTFMKYFEIE